MKKIFIPFLSFFLLSHTSPQDSSLLKRIRDHWIEGDISLAKQQIISYLESHKDGNLLEELHLLLGDAYLQEGNFLAALEEYTYVQQKNLRPKILFNQALCLHEVKKTKELLILLSEPMTKRSLTREQLDSLQLLCALNAYEQASLEGFYDKELLDQAISLLKSTDKPSSTSLLAKCHLLQGDKQKAALCYQLLAKQHPQKEMDFLFEAASILWKTSPKESLSLFEKIAIQQTEKQGPAAYNALLLQYELKQFENVILSYESYNTLFTQEQSFTTTYLLGKSLYALKDYQKAADALLSFLIISPNPSIELQQEIYLLALECFYKTQDLLSYQTILTRALEKTTDQSPYQEACYTYLILLQQYEQKTLFLNEVESFLLNYPDHREKEPLELQFIYALYETENWQKADCLLEKKLKNSLPDSLHTHLLRLQMNCAQILVQNSSSEALSIHRNHLIQVQELALKTPGVLGGKELERTSFELAKNLFLQENFSDAYLLLENFLETYPHSSFTKEALHLVTLCHYLQPTTKSTFTSYAERLLEQETGQDDFLAIRIHLFNAYLEKASLLPQEEKHSCLHKAAELLYPSFKNQECPLQEKNIQWLAEHYYNQASTSLDATEKATRLLEYLLSCTIEKQEENLFRLIKLPSYSMNYAKKITLLDGWLQSNPFTGNKLQKNLLLDLAQAHQKLSHTHKALELYDRLVQSCPSSQIGQEALVNRCKIIFANLQERERTEENIQYRVILQELKDLENKNIIPIDATQLEAALTYIECRASSYKDPISKTNKTIELLHLFHNRFSSLNSSSPSLQSYLSFVEIELLIQEKESIEQARTALDSILQDQNLPSPLKERALIRNQELHNLL